MASPPTNDSSTTVPHRITTLDDLPQNILLRIISFLPTLEAIQTTLISPAFLNLWTSLPSLSFDFSLFLPPADTPSLTLQAFSDFVTRALLLRHPPSSSLRSLHLRLDSSTNHRPYRRHIDSWIQYAVAHNVESLSLTFSSKYLRQFQNETETDSYHYPFPFCLLRNGSVRSLQLKGCNLDLPMNTSRFEWLTCVVFEQVYLTDEMLSDLVSRCLNLERLCILQCHGMKDLKIFSERLKSLELWQFSCDEGSVEICAPNLSYLMMFFFEVGRYVMEDSSAVEEADVTCISKVENYPYWSKIVRLLSHVKRFHVQNWWYKAVVSEDCLPKSFVFHNLNYLRLATEYTKADLLGIAVLFELSPKLETMILDRDVRISEEIFGGSISEEFERINFKLPSLRQLKLNCYWGSMEELHFLSLVLRNEVVLERIVLRPVRLDRNRVIPIVLVKQSHGYHVVQGSFPGCGLHVYQGMDVYKGTEISCLCWNSGLELCRSLRVCLPSFALSGLDARRHAELCMTFTVLESSASQAEKGERPWYRKIVSMVSKDCLPESFVFHNLNYLRLDMEYTKADLLGIAILLELSPKLETMILDRGVRISEEVFGGSISEEFERLNFKLPSLRHLKLNCYWGTMDELHFLSLVLKSEVVLERIVLCPVRLHN